MEARRLALLVATDSYQDGGFRQLHAPQADADALRTVLEDPAVGGYSVEVLANAESHIINQTVDGFLATATPRDMVLLYFSGHGYKDDAGRLYLIAENSRLDLLASTAVSASFIRERLDGCRSQGKIVLLDCCYSGAFPAGKMHRADEAIDVVARLGGRGSAIMTASSAIQLAFENDESKPSAEAGIATTSIFTSALIDGLGTGSADIDGDGLIDFDELYDYVYGRVKAVVPGQTPQRRSDLEGKLYVAASRRGARPVRLPSEISHATSSPLPSVRQAAIVDLKALCIGAHPGTLLAVRIALGTLTEDDSRRVAAAAQAALDQIDGSVESAPALGLSDIEATSQAPSAASLMTTAERDIASLRKTSADSPAEIREAAELEAAEIRDLAKRERDEVLAAAKRQAEEMRSQAQRILEEAERQEAERRAAAQAAAMKLVNEAEQRAVSAERRAEKASAQAEQTLRDAEEHSQQLISNATKNAGQIVTQAKTEADKLLDEGRKQRDSVAMHVRGIEQLLGMVRSDPTDAHDPAGRAALLKAITSGGKRPNEPATSSGASAADEDWWTE